MTSQEKAKLLRSMKRTAKTFCEDEGIPAILIQFKALPKNDYGVYCYDTGVGAPKPDLIMIDVEKENDYVKTFFHELIHHWQRYANLGNWYAECHKKDYSWWTRHISHKTPREVYLNSVIEVEARSFARSIVEDLDSD